MANLRTTWGFLTGALTGAIATVLLVVLAVLLLPLDLTLLTRAPVEVDVVAPPAVAQAPPPEPESAEAPCPTLPVETPPWLADENAKEKALYLPKPSAQLDRRIQFWTAVWGKHPEHVYLFADRRRPSLMHSVVDCRDLYRPGVNPAAAEKRCDRRLIAEKKKIVKALYKRRSRPTRAVRAVFGRDRSLIRTAHRNVFVIEGKADALQEAIARAAEHLDQLEKIFATVGVPPKLTRLSFVESLFLPQVISHAGAAGAFQFVEATGKEWLMIDADVDERLDPERSGWASAHYLRRLYNRFDDWGLALTAYNTGPTRMRRLVKRHKTRDIGALADMRTEKNFGFDGQNYYAQLAAVVRITEALEPLELALSRHTVKMPSPLPIEEIARCTETSVADIGKLNPALGSPILEGKKPVPTGYHLNLPPEAKAVSVEEPKATTAEQPS